MEKSHHLNLPYIAPAQAQKHVTHNEALSRLDILVQLSVKRIDLQSPPQTPLASERYVVAENASDGWSGHDGEIAAWQDGAWNFSIPKPGWISWVESEEKLIAWSGSSWVDPFAFDILEKVNSATLGVNADPDSYNRLFAKSESILFSHDDVTPGSGSIRQTLNKKSDNDTCSLLFQSGYSARSEIGLTGDNNLHIKSSTDGTNYVDALVVDSNTGNIGLGTASPTATLHINGAIRLEGRNTSELPSPEASGAGSISFGIDGQGEFALVYSDGVNWRRVSDNTIPS